VVQFSLDPSSMIQKKVWSLGKSWLQLGTNVPHTYVKEILLKTFLSYSTLYSGYDHVKFHTRLGVYNHFWFITLVICVGDATILERWPIRSSAPVIKLDRPCPNVASYFPLHSFVTIPPATVLVLDFWRSCCLKLVTFCNLF